MNCNNSNKKILIQIRDLRVGNGIATSIMSYYKHIVSNNISIDFLISKDVDSPYKDFALHCGSAIFVMPHNTSKPNKNNINFLYNIISNKYDILHVNTSGFYAKKALEIAKKKKIHKRIYHAHNPREPLSLKVFFRNIMYVDPCIRLANVYVACSKSAGQSVFGNRKFTVINNAIEIVDYRYNKDARERIRKTLKIDENVVVGVVARMENQKNPFFLIDIFEEFSKIMPNAVLIWAGTGSLKEKIINEIAKRNLKDNVILLGIRNDVNQLYSAMDFFLLPSKYEGLGIVFIEAQISGLVCFGSDKVPEDSAVTSNMIRLPLKEKASYWAIEMKKRLNYKRKDMSKEVSQKGYDIDIASSNLIRLYTSSEC